MEEMYGYIILAIIIGILVALIPYIVFLAGLHIVLKTNADYLAKQLAGRLMKGLNQISERHLEYTDSAIADTETKE